jgi:flagellar motor switch protein FliN
MAGLQTAKAAEPLAKSADNVDLLAGMLLVPTTLSVEVQVVNLNVRELFRLEKGSVVASVQTAGANVPLYVGKKLIAWGEFQVVGENLALRVAELA